MPDPDAPDHRGGVDAAYAQVLDPDIARHAAAQRREIRPREWDVVLATSAGGVAGALARYGIDCAVPRATNAFPWSTVLINATGSLLIGVLMVLVLELTSPHRLLRPFLGVGVLGGYTTYSTFAVDVQRLVVAHRLLVAAGYLAVTVASCLVAVWLATGVTQRAGQAVVDRRRERVAVR